jgi:hypothetical protein
MILSLVAFIALLISGQGEFVNYQAIPTNWGLHQICFLYCLSFFFDWVIFTKPQILNVCTAIIMRLTLPIEIKLY